MHALVAIAVSVAAGLITVRPGDYRYWRGWAPSTFALGSLALLVVYALAGFLGYGVFQAVEPGSSSALAAGVQGAAGHAVLRARIERGGVGDDTVGRSILGGIRMWLLELLNGKSRDSIRHALDRLDDPALIALAFQIFWEFAESDQASMAAVEAEQYDRLKAARDQLAGPDQIDGRANLRGFCLGEIQRHRLVLTSAEAG